MAEKKSSGKGKAMQDKYGLPSFNDGSTFDGRFTGPGDHKFISDADAAGIMKSAFSKESTALAPSTELADIGPVETGLANPPALIIDDGPAETGMSTAAMNPMESVMAVFSDMADSLESIKESALELVMSTEPTAQDAIDKSDVEDSPPPPPGGEGDEKKQTKFDKIKDKLPSLKKIGITALIVGALFFIDKLKKPIARMLEFFKNIFDRVSVIFGSDSTLGERVEAFFGIFADFGSYLLDIFDGLTSTVASWIGISFEPYDGLGSWIIGKFTEGFKAIGDFFASKTPAWLVDDATNIKDWLFAKITARFQVIADFFASAKEAYTVGGFTGLWEWTKDKLLTAFKPIVTFFTGAVDAYKVDGASGVWEYVKTKIALAFEPIMTFFTGATEAWTVGGASGVWDYVKTKISDAFAPILTWFKSEEKDGGMFDFDGNPTILSWLVSKLKLPFKFLTDLFSFPETPEEGLFSFEFGGIVVGKFIDFLQLPLNLAINFIKGIFGWGDPEEPFKLSTFISDIFISVKKWFTGLFSWGDDDEKESFSLSTFISGIFTSVKKWFTGLFSWGDDDEKEPFSLSTFIGGVIDDVMTFIKELFTFDTSKITEGFMNFGKFIKAIVSGSADYVKVLLDPRTKGSNIKAAGIAFDETYNAVMGGSGTVLSGNNSGGGNGSTQELKDATSEMNASTGDVVVIDNTNNSTTSTTSDTYNQQELSSDDKESSGSWWSRVDLTPWN